MSYYNSCQEKIDQQLIFYHVAVTLSIALTVGVSVVGNLCLRQQLTDDAHYRARFFGRLGMFKMLFGFGIFFLVPSCPSSCVECGDMSAFFLYPVIAILVGAKWLSKGRAAQRDGDAPVVHAVTVPMAVEESSESGGDATVMSKGGAEMVATQNKTKADYGPVPIVEAEHISPV